MWTFQFLSSVPLITAPHRFASHRRAAEASSWSLRAVMLPEKGGGGHTLPLHSLFVDQHISYYFRSNLGVAWRGRKRRRKARSFAARPLCSRCSSCSLGACARSPLVRRSFVGRSLVVHRTTEVSTTERTRQCEQDNAVRRSFVDRRIRRSLVVLVCRSFVAPSLPASSSSSSSSSFSSSSSSSPSSSFLDFYYGNIQPKLADDQGDLQKMVRCVKKTDVEKYDVVKNSICTSQVHGGS